MSDQSNAATSTEIQTEFINHNELSNAMDEKMIENSKVQTDTGNLENPEHETQTAEEAPEQKPAAEDKFNAKFAALSRREKEIRQREAELEQRLKEIEERSAAAQEQPHQEQKNELPLEYRLKKNPLETLEELGLGYDVLTNLALNEGQMPAEMQLKLMREELESDYKKKFEELETRLAEKEKAEEEQKYQQVINNFKAQIEDFVNQNDDYELIQANEAHDLVYDVIEEHYNETGRVLETKEAATQVERYLQEELESILKKSKKLGSIMQPSQQAKPEVRQSPTLSNSQSARGVPVSADQKLSAEESKARAASLIRWED